MAVRAAAMTNLYDEVHRADCLRQRAAACRRAAERTPPDEDTTLLLFEACKADSEVTMIVEAMKKEATNRLLDNAKLAAG